MNASVDPSFPRVRIATSGPLAGPVEDVQLIDVLKRGVFGFNSRDRRSRPFNLLRSQVVKIMKANGW